MPAPAFPKQPLVLVFGGDDFGVKQRAKEIFQRWRQDLGGDDHEIIDAAVGNSGEALKALARLREALQTLPFFGSGKAVWLQNCSFLGEDRVSGAQAVTEALGALAQELKTFAWGNVRLLVSAGKVDKRKVFYKALEKIGVTESFEGWTVADKDWAAQAELWAARALKEGRKEISDEALSLLVANTGPNPRFLFNEIEKVSLYVGDRERIEASDVTAVCARSKQARAFALGDALGDRDLPKLLKCLDEELWETRRDPQRNEIGLLYGLISKTRALLMAREMTTLGWIKPGRDYSSFKSQLERVPVSALPDDKKFSPLLLNPYVLFRAAAQARNYTTGELVQAMNALLECNQKLISRGLDASLVLQDTLARIVARPA